MIGWNRTAIKMAKEAVKARNAMAVADIDSEVCEGNVELEITPFESFSQTNKYKKYLANVENLRVVAESWSEGEGFNIVVSVRAPLALGRVLQDMPEVARVYFNGNKSGHNGQKHGSNKMVVVMKTAEATPEPVPA
jgi:hypothetical protein